MINTFTCFRQLNDNVTGNTFREQNSGLWHLVCPLLSLVVWACNINEVENANNKKFGLICIKSPHNMQIRPRLNPKISEVVRDYPLAPYVVANCKKKKNCKSGRIMSGKKFRAKQSSQNNGVKESHFSHANYP
jgi:hypothetical protein